MTTNGCQELNHMVDFDLAQVRSFVAVADQRSFRRAAATLAITQQALSKRVKRLEQRLGERLFARTRHDVRITEAGSRFLPHARNLLRIGAEAIASVQLQPEVLRVDVWGQDLPPERLLIAMTEAEPALLLALSMRSDLHSALEALKRSEIDATFGRVNDLAEPWPSRLSYRMAILTPVRALVARAHPLARADVVTPDDIRPYGLGLPGEHMPAEVIGWIHRYADWFDIPLSSGEDSMPVNVAVSTVFDNGANPSDYIRIPIEPRPCFPWYAVWRSDDAHRGVRLLNDAISDSEDTAQWLSFDPNRDWLPDVDISLMRRDMSQTLQTA